MQKSASARKRPHSSTISNEGTATSTTHTNNAVGNNPQVEMETSDPDDLLESGSDIIMALSFSNNTLGLACFHESRNTILLSSYQLSSGDADNVLRMIKLTMSPTIFLLHPNILMNIGLHHLIVKPLEEEESDPTRQNHDTPTGDISTEINEKRKNEYPFKSLRSTSWQEYKLVEIIQDTLQVGHCRRLRNPSSHQTTSSGRSIIPTNRYLTQLNESRLTDNRWSDKSDVVDNRNDTDHSMVFTGIDLYNLISRTVDIDKLQIRQALVALVIYLKETKYQYLLDDRIVLNDILPFPDHAYLQIDNNTFRSLQIFCEEIHPNWIRGKGRNKEGFSLFGLFDRTNSLIGRKKLREWMLKPFIDREKILSRQIGIDFVIHNNNREYIKMISKQLKHFGDISLIIVRIKKAQSSFKDWCKLHTSLISGTKCFYILIDLLNSQNIDEDSKSFIQGVINAVNLDIISMIAERLSLMLDFVESERQQRVVINKGIDPELDDKRMLFDELEDVMYMTATELLKSVPILERLKVEYFPQLGYLVAVEDVFAEVLRKEGYIESDTVQSNPVVREHDGDDEDALMDGYEYRESESVISHRNHNNGIADVDQNDKFSIVYSQNNIVYFKHRLVRRLDSEIGDISSDIADIQKAILLGLEEEVVQCELDIVALYHTLAELDAYISLGEIAIQYNLVKPHIVEDTILVIKGGRHLLQELTVDTFIANDTFVSSDRNIALITGPNGSGKSIYLKQVGLITYLAHIGSFVPCEQAVIGLTDRIMTRISTDDSVSNPQSTFTMDLNQISKMLKFGTSRSLCLIDEFGKGTCPIDGMSLLVGVLRHFATRKGNVFCALHFNEILYEDIIGTSTMKCINFFHMETIKEDNGRSTAFDDEDDIEEQGPLIPLYKLKHGVERCSHGIEYAEKMGIDKSIIQRAKAFKSAIENKTPIQRLWSSEEIKKMEIYEKMLQVVHQIHDFYTTEYVVDPEQMPANRDLDVVDNTNCDESSSNDGDNETSKHRNSLERKGEALISTAQDLYEQLLQIELSSP